MLKVAWSPIYNHPLPPKHRFPMEKYDLLPKQLIHEGTIHESNLFAPRKLTPNEILAVHSANYWKKLQALDFTRQEERRSGFPISQGLVKREVTINAGTIQCAEYALQYGIAMNIAGGTHHAFTDRAEGFCLLNDIAIASRYLLDLKKAQKILVVDLDVHQGNGTAEIFQNEDRVFTFSMHGEHNYPLKKEKSDLDISLADGTEDRIYLKTLDYHLKKLMDQVNPDFIFFQSGVDVLKTDKLGRLGLTINGCRERDYNVISLAKEHNIPLVASMGGGYSENIKHILEAHANTYRVAQEIYF
ncbi:Acetoin utilization deacetylase AcuC [Ekhidna lutea]|uniref:Acetoin utilization deacetylase AcuC n=1 Tax=Ekhidna lutea TaxID=447679 RepID=A0A239GLT5_EKHLU|nr:histone deacetylase [Ekhidna lutea]SNS70226.1 Acetoin utilization deacetylase AcuC [Ekhidna lutea]